MLSDGLRVVAVVCMRMWVPLLCECVCACVMFWVYVLFAFVCEGHLCTNTPCAVCVCVRGCMPAHANGNMHIPIESCLLLLPACVN